MNYDKYIDENNTLIDEAFQLSNDDFRKLVAYLTGKVAAATRLHNMSNVSTSDVVLTKNFNRKFDKSNVCLRVSNTLIDDYKKFAGQLDVPVQDLMNYILEFGLNHFRIVKEI